MGHSSDDDDAEPKGARTCPNAQSISSVPPVYPLRTDGTALERGSAHDGRADKGRAAAMCHRCIRPSVGRSCSLGTHAARAPRGYRPQSKTRDRGNPRLTWRQVAGAPPDHPDDLHSMRVGASGPGRGPSPMTSPIDPVPRFVSVVAVSAVVRSQGLLP